jgi:hypothetical protein
MTSLEKHWRYIWHYASYPYNGTATCCFGSKLNPGTSWREIVKQESIPNEEWTRVGIFLSVYLERETTEATFFHENELSGECRKDVHFLLMADNLLERMTRPPLFSGINTTKISESNDIRKCSHACTLCKDVCYVLYECMYVCMYVWMSCMHYVCWQHWQDELNWR